MRKPKATGLILLLLAGLLWAQSDEYARKSITFLDAIILASPSARDMSYNQVDHVSRVRFVGNGAGDAVLYSISYVWAAALAVFFLPQTAFTGAEPMSVQVSPVKQVGAQKVPVPGR